MNGPRRIATIFHATALVCACVALLRLTALAQPSGPLTTPPNPGANPTATLIFDAMLATARAAATNPRAAQPAQLNTDAAILRYNSGDLTGARFAAIQALIDANRALPQPIPVLTSTIPQTSALQTQPFPLRGDIAALDADAFIAQARGALLNCRTAHSPHTDVAAADLTSAERDARAGRYQNVRVEARAAVDLCAQAPADEHRR